MRATNDLINSGPHRPRRFTRNPSNDPAPTAEAGVPTGTIADVLEWVGEDPQRASEALAAERAGANRSTLVEALETAVEAVYGDVTAPEGDTDAVQTSHEG